MIHHPLIMNQQSLVTISDTFVNFEMRVDTLSSFKLDISTDDHKCFIDLRMACTKCHVGDIIVGSTTRMHAGPTYVVCATYQPTGSLMNPA